MVACSKNRVKTCTICSGGISRTCSSDTITSLQCDQASNCESGLVTGSCYKKGEVPAWESTSETTSSILDVGSTVTTFGCVDGDGHNAVDGTSEWMSCARGRSGTFNDQSLSLQSLSLQSLPSRSLLSLDAKKLTHVNRKLTRSSTLHGDGWCKDFRNRYYPDPGGFSSFPDPGACEAYCLEQRDLLPGLKGFTWKKDGTRCNCAVDVGYAAKLDPEDNPAGHIGSGPMGDPDGNTDYACYRHTPSYAQKPCKYLSGYNDVAQFEGTLAECEEHCNSLPDCKVSD